MSSGETSAQGLSLSRIFSDEELEAAGVNPSVFKRPEYVRAKPVLDNLDLFDASFFGFNPREAEIMDPQHRLFLECASDALENAAYDPDRYRGKIGVYARREFEHLCVQCADES